jgi:hypothetical protein
MKKLCVLCLAIGVALSITAGFGRGGMGSHHMSVTGGPLGTSTAAPGTNPAIDREEVKVDKKIDSICRGR